MVWKESRFFKVVWYKTNNCRIVVDEQSKTIKFIWIRHAGGFQLKSKAESICWQRRSPKLSIQPVFKYIGFFKKFLLQTKLIHRRSFDEENNKEDVGNMQKAVACVKSRKSERKVEKFKGEVEEVAKFLDGMEERK